MLYNMRIEWSVYMRGSLATKRLQMQLEIKAR